MSGDKSNYKHNIKQVTLLRDQILLEPLGYKTHTDGGLLLPPENHEESFDAIVVAVGPGTEDYPITLKAGDKVRYGPFKREEVIYKGKQCFVMREADVFGVYEEK